MILNCAAGPDGTVYYRLGEHFEVKANLINYQTSDQKVGSSR